MEYHLRHETVADCFRQGDHGYLISIIEALHLRSVKDRIAFNMIKRAEEQGIISPEHTTLVSCIESHAASQSLSLSSLL